MICPFCGSSIERKSWPELVLKAGTFHEEKQLANGRTKLHQGRKRGWSLRDSANALSIPYKTMWNIMQIYQEIKKNPAIEKIETLEGAMKFCQRRK